MINQRSAVVAELRPDHANAKSYLAATQRRMQQLGLNRLPPNILTSPGRGATNAANPIHASASAGHNLHRSEDSRAASLNGSTPPATGAADECPSGI